ncbi:hypothetical protein P7C70_g6069, partial [Phenoliferia sp. Uapishka_3]
MIRLLTKPHLENLVLSLLQTPSIASTVATEITTSLIPARTSFFNDILARVEEAVREVENDLQSEGTTDDFADAVHLFLGEVATFRGFPGPGTTAMAFDLVIRIAEATLCDMDKPHGSGYGERRDFDRDADELLVELGAIRREEEPEWKVGEIYNDIRATSRILEGYGIDGWFPKTLELIAPWAREQTEVIVLDDD